MTEPECTLSEPDDFVGLQGAYYGFYTDDPDDLELDRGDYANLHMRYLDAGLSPGPHNEYTPWFMHNYASGGDYGGGLVTKSNFDVLLEKAVELDADPSEVPDECRPFFVTVYGGYGSYGILFHVNRTPKEILEMLGSLEDFPILDEGHNSELEVEAEQEAWNNWVWSDYQRALERAFETALDPYYRDGVEIDLDDVDEDTMLEHFREWSEEANEYWEHEESGPHIDVEKIAEEAASGDSADDILDALPKGAKIEGDRKTPGDKLYDFFFSKDDDYGMNGLSGELVRFPHARRQNQIDIQKIREAVATVFRHGDFRRKPGPFDQYAPGVEFLQMTASAEEPVEVARIYVGYTHDFEYAKRVAMALNEVLEEQDNAAVKNVIVTRVIPPRL